MSKRKGLNYKIEKKKKQIEFKINTKIYSLTAIYHTAYLFLDKAYIFLDGDPKKQVKVIMKLKPSSASSSSKFSTKPFIIASAELEQIVGEFYNELLNQLLREKVSQINAKIREYIVAQALYNAVPNEVDQLLKEVEEEDWQTDPLGIAKTWEESQVVNNKS